MFAKKVGSSWGERVTKGGIQKSYPLQILIPPPLFQFVSFGQPPYEDILFVHTTHKHTHISYSCIQPLVNELPPQMVEVMGSWMPN